MKFDVGAPPNTRSATCYCHWDEAPLPTVPSAIGQSAKRRAGGLVPDADQKNTTCLAAPYVMENNGLATLGSRRRVGWLWANSILLARRRRCPKGASRFPKTQIQ